MTVRWISTTTSARSPGPRPRHSDITAAICTPARKCAYCSKTPRNGGIVNRYLGACLVASGALLSVTTTFQAQQRAVSGRVSNAVNEEPVGGATVSLVGAANAAVTDAKGQFSLPAPDGPLTLIVRAIGYKRRQVPVGPQQSSIAVRLDQDIFNLEAVVVTGQATGIEQRNLPQAVTGVHAQALERAPASKIESAPQGKIPGAHVDAGPG